MSKLRTLTGYLVVKPKGTYTDLSGRWATRMPSLDADEIAIEVSVSVPDVLFRKPTLSAKIELPESIVPLPRIPTQVMDNVREAIEKTTGLKIEMAFVEPTDGSE